MPDTLNDSGIRRIFSEPVADAVLSADGAHLYVTSGSSVFDVEVNSGTILRELAFSSPLGAIDLSADGKSLAVVVSESRYSATAATLFRIDPLTGAFTQHSFPIGQNGVVGPFHDVVLLSNGSALLSQEGGAANVLRYDFTQQSITNSGFAGETPVLIASLDHDDVLAIDASIFGISAIINVDRGVAVSRVERSDPYAGAGVPLPLLPVGAISPQGDHVALGDALTLMDEMLVKEASFLDGFPFGYPDGMRFAPAGDALYIAIGGNLVKFDVATRTAIGVYSVGAPVESRPDFGNGLQISNDGRYMAMILDDGVSVIDLQTATPTTTNGNDVVTAGLLIFGLDGNDRLGGGADDQRMYGGKGDDVYFVGLGDTVIERPGEGHDKVFTSIGFVAEGVEEVTYTGTGDAHLFGDDGVNSLTGAAGDDVLYGGGEDDSLEGADGKDMLDGGTGADKLTGGRGDDIYQVDDDGDRVVEKAGEGTDEVRAWLSEYTLASNVENLVGLSNSGQTLTGNDLGNVIKGGQGADTMVGRGGDDHYYIDNPDDIVIELTAQGYDTVHSIADGIVLSDNVEALVLEGYARDGEGNDLANVLTGGQAAAETILVGHGGDDVIRTFGGDDILDGGAGNDTMTGGRGDDLYLVDSTGDVLVEAAGEGIDAVISSIDFTLAANFEQLLLTGQATLGTGNAADNLLIGNDRDNTLRGFAGNDALDGDAGKDMLYGGLGADAYRVDDIGDTVVENAGEGTDSVFASISYVLGSNLENLVLEGEAVIDGTGNARDNLIQGNAGVNLLRGLDGDDVLGSGGAADTLDGGAGRDIAVFSYLREDYAIVSTGTGAFAVTEGEVTTTLIDIEVLRFADGEYVWDDAAQSTLKIFGGRDAYSTFLADGFVGEFGGSGLVVGTAGLQDVTVSKRSGEVSFDGSFNRGGDIIRLHGDAGAWSIRVAGSQAVLQDGYSAISIPVGTEGTTLVFEDGARTLAYNEDDAIARLGQQVLTTTSETISAAPASVLPSIVTDPDAQGILFMSPNAHMIVNGQVSVTGTIGKEQVTAFTGDIALDGSFNRGGDVLILAKAASAFSARTSGSQIVLESEGLNVSIPIGEAGMTIDFAGDERTVQVVAGKAQIDDQIITANMTILG